MQGRREEAEFRKRTLKKKKEVQKINFTQHVFITIFIRKIACSFIIIITMVKLKTNLCL